MCPAKDYLISSHIVDYVYDLGPLSDPEIRSSVIVRRVVHTYFHFTLQADGKVFGVCAQVYIVFTTFLPAHYSR